MLIEKYVQRPRHIEIQVFGDTQGNYVYLFERDCSVQRRHQKVLEEAPAPGMTPALREQMGQAAIAAARAVNYVGAGTVEFIVEPGAPKTSAVKGLSAAGPSQGAKAPSGGSAAREAASVGAFYFMEMNTRLQVEHPVTEAITGLDLVEWQLRVASGEALPLKQEQLQINGHAIEARICAEVPDREFLPATGTLNVYGLPACSEFERGPVRVDSGVRQGDSISPYYDSMVAKLIVHGATREEALSRLDSALAQTHIVGLATNVQFLRQVVKSSSFAKADLDTALIERERSVLFNQESVSFSLAAASAVAFTLLQERAAENASKAADGWVDPFARRDGWCAYGVSSRTFEFEFRAQPATALLTYLHDGALLLKAGPMQGSLSMSQVAPDLARGIDLIFADERHRVQVYRCGEVVHVFAQHGAAEISVLDALAHAGEAPAEAGRLTAPMPGKVVSVSVKAGDKVFKGQVLAVMEAMKMEHTLSAPFDGVVSELLYAPGDQVAEGAELLKLTP
jgi:3-methylcrotonyl-CoA carboxylase alpha subunit